MNSTSAQMGFMILTCGLGLWAAAVIHLVAHGFYKATLFLSSGSAIASRRRHEALPAALRPTRRGQFLATAATLAVPTAAVHAALAVAQLPAGDHAAEQALLGFAWVTGAAITWGWLQRRPGIAGVLSVAALLIPGTIAYLAVINAVSGFLAPALPPSALPTPAVWVITVTALVALAALAPPQSRRPRARRRPRPGPRRVLCQRKLDVAAPLVLGRLAGAGTAHQETGPDGADLFKGGLDGRCGGVVGDVRHKQGAAVDGGLAGIGRRRRASRRARHVWHGKGERVR